MVKPMEKLEIRIQNLKVLQVKEKKSKSMIDIIFQNLSKNQKGMMLNLLHISGSIKIIDGNQSLTVS